MSEADDLARRFFALWAEYLSALASDPKMAEPLRRWLAFASGPLRDASPGDDGAGLPPRSPPDAAAAAGASGERDPAVAELARRVDELAERVAALESRRRAPRGAAGRGGTARAGS